MANIREIGFFRGTELVSKSSKVGGHRHVFAKLQGEKEDLIYPVYGGAIKNSYDGFNKFFAGDLIEFRTDERYSHPEVYILYTFKVFSLSGTTLKIERDGFLHIPHVGQIVMVAPSVIGGTGLAVTITAVSETTENDGTKTWTLTTSATLTGAKKGDILVEAESAGSGKAMLVKNINAVADCDCDFFDVVSKTFGTKNDTDFNNARLLYTPALGGTMYMYKMSPIPQCVLDLNQINLNGLFRVNAISAPMKTIATMQADVKQLKA